MKKTQLAIPPPREESICDLANYLGEEYKQNGKTNLEQIAQDKSIGIYYGSFEESFDGLLVYEEESFSVFCNTKQGNSPSSARSRFTIAHEFGHFFIDDHRKKLMQNLMPSMGEQAPKDLIIEREADLFASHLLIPQSSLESFLKKRKSGLKDIIELSSKFSVSAKCAAIRYVTADPISCALAFWSWDGDMVWSWISKSMWDSGQRKVNGESISGGATNNCLKKRGENNFSDSTASTISYSFSSADNVHKNEILTEEAMVLGDYGVISLYSTHGKKLKPLASVIDERLSYKKEF